MSERVIDYSNREEAVEIWREIIRSYVLGSEVVERTVEVVDGAA